MNKHIDIAIVGGIGVGKSTITKLLKEKIEDSYLLEESITGNPFLYDMYKDLPKWAALAQFSFLNQRILNHRKALDTDYKYLIHDRVFLEEYIFTENMLRQGIISLPEYTPTMYVFKEWYKLLMEEWGKFDHIFFIKQDFDLTYKRIIERDRNDEVDTNKQYFEDLHKLYYENENWIQMLKDSSKKFITIDRTDLESEEVVDIILKEIK